MGTCWAVLPGRRPAGAGFASPSASPLSAPRGEELAPGFLQPLPEDTSTQLALVPVGFRRRVNLSRAERTDASYVLSRHCLIPGRQEPLEGLEFPSPGLSHSPSAWPAADPSALHRQRAEAHFECLCETGPCACPGVSA